MYGNDSRYLGWQRLIAEQFPIKRQTELLD